MTPKQERFVAEYLVDLNATQAATRAGYSAKTAQEQGSRLLSNAMVAKAVKAGQAKRLARTEITQDKALKEAARLAFSDVRQLFDAHGNLLPVKDWPDGAAAAVAGVDVVKRNVDSGDGKTDDVLKVRLWDKSKNLEMLFKHLGLLKDSVEHLGEIRFKWES